MCSDHGLVFGDHLYADVRARLSRLVNEGPLMARTRKATDTVNLRLRLPEALRIKLVSEAETK